VADVGVVLVVVMSDDTDVEGSVERLGVEEKATAAAEVDVLPGKTCWESVEECRVDSLGGGTTGGAGGGGAGRPGPAGGWEPCPGCCGGGGGPAGRPNICCSCSQIDFSSFSIWLRVGWSLTTRLLEPWLTAGTAAAETARRESVVMTGVPKRMVSGTETNDLGKE